MFDKYVPRRWQWAFWLFIGVGNALPVLLGDPPLPLPLCTFLAGFAWSEFFYALRLIERKS